MMELFWILAVYLSFKQDIQTITYEIDNAMNNIVISEKINETDIHN
jgi:hypothetical protein